MILIIGDWRPELFPNYAGAPITTLRLLGYTVHRAWIVQRGTEIVLALPDGEYPLHTDSPALRTRLRDYNAVIIQPTYDAIWDANTPIAYTLRFLSWNDPQDPPFVYLGVHFGTNRTAIALPSDFPLVRPNRNNLASTAHTTEPPSTRLGTHAYRVRLTREQTELYLACFINESNPMHLWRLDTANHNALGSDGEVLAEVIGEDYAFDATPVCAYRYKNCYLMPSVMYGTAPSGAYRHRQAQPQQMFWLLYALKCVGLSPRYRLPVLLQVDDLQHIGGPLTPRFPGAPFVNDWLRALLATYEWYANEFFPRTEIPLWAALTTGGRYGLYYGAWTLLVDKRRMLQGGGTEPLDSTGAALAEQLLRLFQREQNRSMRICFHDHDRLLRTTGSTTRHSDAGYPLAAPNDVPMAHGRIVRKGHIAPPANAVEIEVDGEVYYDINPPRTGSANTFLYAPTLHAARILIERNVAEMRAMGFADGGIGGEARFHITAGGNFGSAAVMQALYEIGVRICRNNVPPFFATERSGNTLYRPVRGVWQFRSDTVDAGDATNASELNNTGLYDADQPLRSFIGAYSAFNPANDISGIWTTDPIRAQRRAYRRCVGHFSGSYFDAVALPHTMAFSHPFMCLCWCDPADPLRRFTPSDSLPSGSPGPYINVLLEAWLNFELMYRVLREYFVPATGENVIATRERWMESV
jgi:hypothetical protein